MTSKSVLERLQERLNLGMSPADFAAAKDARDEILRLQAALAVREDEENNLKPGMSEKSADFQSRAVQWVKEAFGTHPEECREERAHRFLEEALEAVQAAGTTQSEAQALVKYVFGRPAGEVAQEVGGVMLTLAPFAAVHGVDMMAAGETELARVNTPEIIAKCRAKNASKPRNSPLPGVALAQAGQEGQP